MAVDPVQSFETIEATIALFNPFGLKANEFIAHHKKKIEKLCYVRLPAMDQNGAWILWYGRADLP